MGCAHVPPPLSARCSAYTCDSVPLAEICPAGYVDWEGTPSHMPRLWEPSHILVNVRQEAPGPLSQPAAFMYDAGQRGEGREHVGVFGR